MIRGLALQNASVKEQHCDCFLQLKGFPRCQGLHSHTLRWHKDTRFVLLVHPLGLGNNRMGAFRKGGFSNSRFVLKPEVVAIASKVSISSRNSLAITDFHAKKTQHVQLFENPLPGTPPHSRFPTLGLGLRAQKWGVRVGIFIICLFPWGGQEAETLILSALSLAFFSGKRPKTPSLALPGGHSRNPATSAGEKIFGCTKSSSSPGLG